MSTQCWGSIIGRPKKRAQEEWFLFRPIILVSYDRILWGLYVSDVTTEIIGTYGGIIHHSNLDPNNKI